MSATVFFQSTSEVATLTNTFSVAGVATDATAVTLTVTSPSGTATAYTSFTHVGGTGLYSKDVTCDEAGEWSYLWEGTGSASDAAAGTWTVYETTLGKLYCTPTALKSRLGITSTVDDYEIHAACFAASRQVEQICERTFYRSASGTARTFEPCELYWLKFGPYNDLVTLASVKTDAAGDGTFETTWASTDYKLYPLNPAAAPETRPYTKIKAVGSNTFPYPTGVGRDDTVEITGVWGWSAVPHAVRKAALMIAEDIHKSAPFGVVGIGDFGPLRVRQNPLAQALLAPYVHPAVAVKVA